MTRFLSALILALASTATALPQDDPALPAQQKSAPASDIFSGVVTALTSDSVTVVRKVPAKQDVSRTFARDAQTKVEGALKVRARVSVRFRSADEGQFLALNIIVR